MKMKKADIGVALYVLGAMIMLIVPISDTLLDVLLAINISLAFTILFTTMFAKEVLDLSFYPTILLFTTIFRIARIVDPSDPVYRKSGKRRGDFR